MGDALASAEPFAGMAGQFHGNQTMVIPTNVEKELASINAHLEGKSPQAILRWTVETYFPRLTMATAFGAEGCCLIHMLAEIEPRSHIFNLDTGYQFPETLEVRERIRERYGIAVEMVKPELDVPAYEASHGGPLYVQNPDQCCHDRKLVPLRRALVGFEAWISAIRRNQTSHRATAMVVQWDQKFGLMKVNPLLAWTTKDVWAFIARHDIPYNHLHDQGFPSIGCWPCTRAVAAGQDERAGRWAGSAKKECGLHVMEQEGGSGI
jgi:phosphoadenosine phosphosulfate reductase